MHPGAECWFCGAVENPNAGQNHGGKRAKVEGESKGVSKKHM